LYNLSSCQKLVDIIGGEVVQSTPVCVIMRLRDIQATILGRRTLSPLALPFMLTFENNDLNLGDTVLLQKEVNPIKKAPIYKVLEQNGCTFSEYLFKKFLKYTSSSPKSENRSNKYERKKPSSTESISNKNSSWRIYSIHKSSKLRI
jgi:hypothetical protein